LPGIEIFGRCACPRKPRLRIVNFSVAMTDNILVIDGRRRLRTVLIRRIFGEADRLHVKIVAARASCAHAAIHQ